MKKYGHGGDKYGLLRQASKLNDGNFVCNKPAGVCGPAEILDFSANTNPLGMPLKVKEAAMLAVGMSECYPDPFCRELVERICVFESSVAGYQVPGSWVVCGNGAADLIFRVSHAAKLCQVLVLAPTFSEYEEAAWQAGGQVDYYYLKEEDGFCIGEDFLDRIHEGLDGIFLCNPNNPVGNIIDKELLLKILRKAKDNNVFLFEDECFLELTGRLLDESLVGMLKDYDNLVIFKAFTKTYAMAGLRLGYLLTSNEDLAEKIFNTGQPWSVSTPAQMAGIACLDEKEYVEKSIRYIESQRYCLFRELEKMGFKVYGGKANYIFFYDKYGKRFIEEMRKRGILVRDCENYVGLSEGFMRISVGNMEENKAFLENAREVLKWLKG